MLFLRKPKKRKITLIKHTKNFKNISGLGVEAVIGTKHILVGTVKLMESRKVSLSSLQQEIDRLVTQGKTIMLVAVNKKLVGVIAALDPVKKTSRQTITLLHQLDINSSLITGDNKKTAESIGNKLGINNIYAEVLPQEKAIIVKNMQHPKDKTKKEFVSFVGDGVNDAPALAQSDIGIAIGAGTDVAIQTANIVLMKSDPLDILRAIHLSKATVRKMKQNLFWASIYNLLAIPFAAGAFYPQFGIILRPEVSALLMSISSIIVATNAVLLKRVDKDLDEVGKVE